MPTLVMKFGGSLAADARSIRRVAQIIAAESLAWPRMVVVISAMAGTTDALAHAADLAAVRDGSGYRQQIGAIRSGHVGVIETLFTAQTTRDSLIKALDARLFGALTTLDAICARHDSKSQDRDAIMAIGERLMADILITLLHTDGLRSALVDSAEWLITDDHFQNANPLSDLVEERVERVIKPLLAAGMVTLTHGFVGVTRTHLPTTLGRGGSDYSATVLAAVLGADEVWMWTHVDGIMSADPSLVPNARVIESLSYDDMRELSYFGVRVLHPRAIDPLLPGGIPMRVRSPGRVEHGGTLIGAQAALGGLKAVSAIDGLLLTSQQAGIDLPEVLAQVNRAVGQAVNGPVIVLQGQGGAMLAFVVPTSEGPAAVSHVAHKLASALPAPRWSVKVVKIVAALGSPTQQSAVPGVQVLAYAQSAEDRCLLAVAPEDVQATVRYLHRLT